MYRKEMYVLEINSENWNNLFLKLFTNASLLSKMFNFNLKIQL